MTSSKEIEQKDMKEYEILFTEEKIKQRVSELGLEISGNFPDESIPLIMIPILTGALYFGSDLSRATKRNNLWIEPMKIDSYGYGKNESSRDPKILLDLNRSVEGCNVLIVEDIVDTGYSMASLLKLLGARDPKSLEVCSLLSKDDNREIRVPIDYLGFDIPNRWVRGYGLDNKGLSRALPYIEIEKRS